jgi:hypothetical protein
MGGMMTDYINIRDDLYPKRPEIEHLVFLSQDSTGPLYGTRALVEQICLSCPWKREIDCMTVGDCWYKAEKYRQMGGKVEREG